MPACATARPASPRRRHRRRPGRPVQDRERWVAQGPGQGLAETARRGRLAQAHDENRDGAAGHPHPQQPDEEAERDQKAGQRVRPVDRAAGHHRQEQHAEHQVHGVCERDRDACHDDRREDRRDAALASNQRRRTTAAMASATTTPMANRTRRTVRSKKKVATRFAARMVAAKVTSSHRAIPRGQRPGRGGEHDPGQQDVADGARHAGDLAEAGDRGPGTMMSILAAIASSTGPTRLSGRWNDAIDPAMR